MEIEYQDFEERLARLHNVADVDRKAFKGRLRVLRDMGIPDKPSLGSGKRLKFDTRDLLETHIALKLAAFGLSPHRIALAIKYLRDVASSAKRSLVDLIRSYDETVWLVISVRSNVGKAQDIGENIEAVISFMTLKTITDYFSMCADPTKFWGSPSETHSNLEGIINATQLLKDIEN